MWKRWRIRILLFLAVLGPGFITANVDNDSGGIFTYSQAGRTVRLLAAVDDDPHHPRPHCRAGDVRTHGRGHRKGLSDLIREEFGLRVTVVVMGMLVIVNFTNVIT